jgi:Uncharacterised nucleotidyltransferase
MNPPPPVTRTFVPPSDTTAWNPTRMPPEELSPALQAAVVTLRVDSVTAEVVSRLRSAGVQPILLKGPSIAAWLYADDSPPRPYGDTDLLVESGALPSTSRALRAAGFREQPAVSSYTWFRRSDGSFVDIHDTLFSAEAPLEEAWRTLSAGTETMSVCGLDVDVLSRPARLLYVALHAAQHESDGFKQPLGDLERALHRVDEKYWHEAAALARRLQAAPTFAAGLRLHPDGADLAVRLDLPHDRPLMLSLREEGGSSLVVTLERLATTPGLGARLRLLARRFAPPPDYMRWRYPRLVGRGRFALALAYAWRPVSVALRLPATIIAWRRARHKPR